MDPRPGRVGRPPRNGTARNRVPRPRRQRIAVEELLEALRSWHAAAERSTAGRDMLSVAGMLEDEEEEDLEHLLHA